MLGSAKEESNLSKQMEKRNLSKIHNPSLTAFAECGGGIEGSNITENVHHGELPSHDWNGLSQNLSEMSHLRKDQSNNNFRDEIVSNDMSDASPLRDDVLDITEDDDVDARVVAVEDEENAIVLDPKNSERQYIRDPFTGLQREIWRPGDGDGDKAVDYFESPGPPAPLEERWRLYQSRTGNGPIRRGINEPPKYVILDDRAAYEVLASDIHRKKLTENWGHDFGGVGKIRSRRPHRGRGAIGDPDAKGDDKFHFGKVGVKDERYYFTGELDYKSIIYRSTDESEPEKVSAETEVLQALKRKAKSPPPNGRPNPKKCGHNQHTPKNQLVKNGARGSAAHPKRRRPSKLNQFLRRDPTPDLPFDTAKAKAKISGLQLRHSIEDEEVESIFEKDEGRGMWVSPDDTNQRYEAVDPNEGSGSDMEEFPFHRRSVASATPAPEPPREKQQPQRRDFFQRQLAEQEAADEGDGGYGKGVVEEDARVDSGSYASRLERELAKAKEIIEEQKVEMEMLRKAHGGGLRERIKVLEAEVGMLRSVEKVDDGDGDDEDGDDEDTD